MDVLPLDTLFVILEHLKRCVDEEDHIYLFRSVCKVWDQWICHSTLILPFKFSLWFARKSIMDTDVFVPISYCNLTQMKLYERHHVIRLFGLINHFKKLSLIDLHLIEGLYDSDYKRLKSLPVSRIITSEYDIINQQIVRNAEYIIRYTTK